VDKDLTDNIVHFGSPNSALIAADFTKEQRNVFVIRKKILWESEAASDLEVTNVETHRIQKLESNDPFFRYNRFPPFAVPPKGSRSKSPDSTGS